MPKRAREAITEEMTTNIDYEVDNIFEFDNVKLFEDVVNAALDAENCPYEVDVNLIITNDENIRQINKDTRGIDKSTDVLSFPMNNFPAPADFSELENDMSSFEPDSGELILGDIILSIDHIINQANEYGHSIEREYAFLIAHSMLHLMGYDHMEDDERIIMEEHQNIIMDELIKIYKELKVD